MRRLVLSVAALLSLLPGCALHHAIPRAQLQAQVASRFPVEQAVILWRLRLHDPVLALDGAANRASLDLGIDAAGPGLRTTGRAAVTGSVDYREAEGAFFLNDPT